MLYIVGCVLYSVVCYRMCSVQCCFRMCSLQCCMLQDVCHLLVKYFSLARPSDVYSHHTFSPSETGSIVTANTALVTRAPGKSR